MKERTYELINGNNVDVTTVMDKDIVYIPTTEECENLIAESNELLEKFFDFDDDAGIHQMFDEDGEFWKAKGWLIQAFKKHPGYNGNLQIVLRDTEITRTINRELAYEFFSYCRNWVANHREYYWEGKPIDETTRRELYRHWDSIWLNAIPGSEKEAIAEKNKRTLTNPVATKEAEFFFEVISIVEMNLCHEVFDTLTDALATEISDLAAARGINFRTSAGQKVSKLISKLGKLAGITTDAQIRDVSFTDQNGVFHTRTKDFGWNYQFAKFADAINPLKVNATGILSVNPIDYWTMSFGHDWASCHTIDKNNTRHTDNNYHGMYCGGTESYMLDDSSVIFYTLPKDYDGEHPELEDKWKRCMFYLGEDKLIQSRLYPDGRDGGDQSIAGNVRNIVQRIVAEIFDVPNLWELKRGTEPCGEVSDSYGPHYRDYLHYEDCNVSVMKRIDGYRNHKKIRIGVPRIICPCCGTHHRTEDNIFCDTCAKGGYIDCEQCGCTVAREDAYEIDGDWYCPDCVTYCKQCGELILVDGSNWSDSEEGYFCEDCTERYLIYSDYENDWILESNAVETEEGNWYLENSDGYGYCDECGEYHDNDELIYDEVTGYTYCRDCYDDIIARRESENESGEE